MRLQCVHQSSALPAPLLYQYAVHVTASSRQPLNQARAAAAGQRAQEGFWPDTPEGSNSHVIVRLRPAAL